MLASMQKAVVVKPTIIIYGPVEYQWEGVARKLLVLIFVGNAIGVGPIAVVEYVAMQEKTRQIC